MVRLLLVLVFSFFIGFNSFCQESDSAVFKNIFNTELSQGIAYSNLHNLCKTVGGRLSGSSGAALAVEWAKRTFLEMKADTVYLQEVKVPHWVRGKKEEAWILDKDGKKINVSICALGGSVATTSVGISAEVIEVKNFEELKVLGIGMIKGKIIFFNRPMDPTEVEVFHAYGKAVDQRWAGPSEAAKYGAIATVCRSMTTSLDDFPHTGGMHYTDSLNKIPCCAISTKGAEMLSGKLKRDPHLKFFLSQTCHFLPDTISFNVVAEIRGYLHPEEIIVAGGHLDSWDQGEGAHDDGAGLTQCMEVIYLFKTLGIRPKHTIRIVAFMNEENGLRGGKKYAEIAKAKNEKHLVALESDAGAFSPRGFTLDGDSVKRNKLNSWKELWFPYGLYNFSGDGGGADISPMKEQGVPLMELSPDSQRYFDFHHTSNDVFENVNKREHGLCAASMAGMIFLLDKYGW